MYQWYFCKILPYFGENNVELHYIDTDSIVFFTPNKGSVNDLKHFNKDLDLSEIDPAHELY